MPIHDLLLAEFDYELPRTLTVLERVPHQPDFRPHPKSTALGRLAAHLAQLPEVADKILTMHEFDFASGTMKPLQYESAAQLVSAHKAAAAHARAVLAGVPDAAWSEPWKLAFEARVIFAGARFTAYRAMFMNHLVHHRAQLGVYLRLQNVPVPSVYGPSADEPAF